MRLDGHRVGVYGGDAATLRVDGRVRVAGPRDRISWPWATGTCAASAPPTSSAGPTARRSRSTASARRRCASRSLPSDALRGQLRGILGSNDGIAENDLATATGRRIDYTLPTGGDYRVPSFGAGVDDFEWLHGPYADSWRVRAAGRCSTTAAASRRRRSSTAPCRATEFTLADLSAAAARPRPARLRGDRRPLVPRGAASATSASPTSGLRAARPRAERDRGGWRPLDGFETRVGRLSGGLDPRDGTVVFAAQNAIFGAETLATR